ncbi:MAG: PLP-dependent aminotransferase family protein [Clostridia bacterium]|nr:PLP-dependent aminotransferase family protein [Clostridia bacterium]
MDYIFSDKISSLQPSAIREILKASSVPGMIALAAGNPAPDSFPIDAIKEISQDIFENHPIEALQYGVTEGYPALIKRVTDWLHTSKKIGKDTDSVIITSGAQQVMDLTTKVLCNEGDVVIAETPSFIGSLNCFRAYNVKLRGVSLEDDGINIEELEKALKEEPKAKFIYVIPNFQNPSGITMSVEKRKAVYNLACKYNKIILEDNPYGDTRVAGEDLPSIKSFDEEGRVIYAGTFSKVMAPGIRVGYVLGPSAVVAKMTVGKQTSDVHTPMFNQMLVEKWMANYDIDEHIAKIKDCYRERLNFLCKRIDEELGGIVKYVRPEGGLFVWCDLPENIDMIEFCNNAIKRNVAVVPGTAFVVNDDDKFNAIRLNFTTPTIEAMDKGLKILGEVAAEMNKR